MKIIGREHEQMELRRLLSSDNPEFVMIYGRRRVGKTFLVRETLGKDFCFAMTGLAKQKREDIHYNGLINKNITLDDLMNM